MKINRIYYMNLDRRADRNAFFRRHLEELGTDMSLVHRFSSHDGMAYSSVEALCEAAVKDGFPQLSEAHGTGLGSMGCLWTFRSVLRLIQASDDIAMVFIDDCYVKQPIAEFNTLLSYIPSADFRILQIDYWFPDEMDSTNQEPDILESCPDICRNFRGAGDKITIFSPAGADFLLSEMDKLPLYFPENILYELIPQRPYGCYSTSDKMKWVGYKEGRQNVPGFIYVPLQEQDRMLADMKH